MDVGLTMDSSTLDNLLVDTTGVVGVVVGTADGEVLQIDGEVADGDAVAAVAASLTGELGKIGALLNLGELRVASLKAATAARVFTRQTGAVIAIELDAKRPLGDIETKLRSMVWAAEDEFDAPAGRGPIGRAEPAGPAGPAAPLTRPVALPLPPPPRDRFETSDPFEHSGERTNPRLQRPTPAPPIASDRVHRPAPTPPPRSSSARIPAVRLPTPPPVAPMRPTPPPAALVRPSQQVPVPPSRPTPPPHSGPAPAATAGSGPVFTGDLEEFCLPDLLEFLRNSHRTGILSCTTETGSGTVQLSRGMITGADSPNALDLREHFLTNPELGLDRRRALAALPPECFGEDAIDDELGARALVSREEIETARTARIYSAFREMIAWTRGRFSFDPAAPITHPALALSAQSILMQIYQEQDEQDR
jgi:predicted regulator of Ras-like GTPase activity (Roadblock/LC7/MglB family)